MRPLFLLFSLLAFPALADDFVYGPNSRASVDILPPGHYRTIEQKDALANSVAAMRGSISAMESDFMSAHADVMAAFSSARNRDASTSIITYNVSDSIVLSLKSAITREKSIGEKWQNGPDLSVIASNPDLGAEVAYLNADYKNVLPLMGQIADAIMELAEQTNALQSVWDTTKNPQAASALMIPIFRSQSRLRYLIEQLRLWDANISSRADKLMSSLAGPAVAAPSVKP